MRIEIVGIFAVTLLLALSALSYESRNNNLGLAVGFIGASMAAACHPYSMVLGVAFIAVYGALSILQCKALDKFFCVLSVGFILGIVSFWLWLSLQPECLSQFFTNLHLQKSFYQNYDSLYEGLKCNYRFGIGLILWAAAIGGLVFLTLGARLKRPIDLAPGNNTIIVTSILFLTLCVMHTVTKCENFYYLGFGAPLIAIILSAATSQLNRGNSKWIGKIISATFGLIVILAFSLFPLRLYNYYTAGFPSIISSKKALLASIPAQSTVFIPPDYWNVAYSDPTHNFKFWTFCVASSYSKRHDYESQAYRSLNNNAFLIVNEIGLGLPDKFGIGPTFNISPPDPDHWVLFNRLRQIYPGKVPWGLNYAVYHYKN
jgi:hypothetical protein